MSKYMSSVYSAAYQNYVNENYDIETTGECPQCAADNEFNAEVCHECGFEISFEYFVGFDEQSEPSPFQMTEPDIPY